MAAKYEDSDQALYPKTGCGLHFKSSESVCGAGKIWRQTSGYVSTPHGYVRAWTTYYENSYSHSYLTIIKNGREFYRRFNQEFTARGLVTKAKQFAKDVFEK